MRTISTTPVVALLTAACLVACGGQRGPSQPWEFDFVYGSHNHIPPTERMLRTTASPEKVLAVVRDELTRASATEMLTVDTVAVWVNSEEDVRWRERVRIAEAEWSAYGRYDRRAVEAIERPEGLGRRPPDDPEIPAVRLTARVWERDAVFEYTTVTKRETYNRQGRTTARRTDTKTKVTSDPMASEISFLVWSGNDAVTRVYITAVPIIDEKRQSENPKLAIKWLPFARGFDEFKLVRTYQKILRRRLPPAP